MLLLVTCNMPMYTICNTCMFFSNNKITKNSFVLFYLQTKLEFGQNIIVFGRYLSSITVESEHTRIPDIVETYNIHAIR